MVFLNVCIGRSRTGSRVYKCRQVWSAPNPKSKPCLLVDVSPLYGPSDATAVHVQASPLNIAELLCQLFYSSDEI